MISLLANILVSLLNEPRDVTSVALQPPRQRRVPIARSPVKLATRSCPGATSAPAAGRGPRVLACCSSSRPPLRSSAAQRERARWSAASARARPTPRPRTRWPRAAPTAVLHVGIAGRPPRRRRPLLATVIGTQAVDCDGDSEPIAPYRASCSPPHGARCPRRWRCRSGRAHAWAARAASRSRRWRATPCSPPAMDEGVPGARAARDLERGRGARSRALALRRCLRGARARDRARRSRRSSAHERLLRLLALPQRHVRVRCARPRPHRRAVHGHPRAARHRGAERARAHGPLRAHEALVRRARRRSATATRCCAAVVPWVTAAARSSSRASRPRCPTRRSAASPSRAGTPPHTSCCAWRHLLSGRSSSCATTRSSMRSPREPWTPG